MSVRTILAALWLIVVCANTGYAQTAEELQAKMRGPCKDSDQTYTLIDLSNACRPYENDSWRLVQCQDQIQAQNNAIGQYNGWVQACRDRANASDRTTQQPTNKS